MNYIVCIMDRVRMPLSRPMISGQFRHSDEKRRGALPAREGSSSSKDRAIAG
ncbi:hypothetical protein HMPREF0762_02079 [Slackia exigua ATCC 700122]|uniref:Uncharacterized protein n=1 Tax=Slackia exigua (strain ATCC 700122 / DSM 15923 / CIP 105133 / JCM 11022 / KCTC 5966 / S-7) TaxID=649764 RepID=D0WJQ2_SLAES|nr:hypothetical protein HMPREF0762_02079 [Slackia exigua ATCC 700122]